MAFWTPTSLVRRGPGARDPRAAMEAGTKRPIGPRRAAREAREAEEAAQEADRAMKHELLRQVRYFSEFSAGERKALCEAMHRVDARAGERVMTHLPRLERESRADSAAAKTSARTFHRALLRAKQTEAKNPETTKKEKTAFTTTFRRDDAWYVVAAGAVGVHVSVPGDPGDTLADDASPRLGDAARASSRSPSRLKWHGAFSKAKRLQNGDRRRDGSGRSPRLPPRTATLRVGSFFGALDDAFVADPRETVVFVAAETPTVLFAVPGERFPDARTSEFDEPPGETESSSARSHAEEEERDASMTSIASRAERRDAKIQARFASAAAKVVAFHRHRAPLLDRLPMLSTALTPFQRALLIGSAATTRSFRPFELIEREADPGDACWIVADGDAHATASVAGFETHEETHAIDAEVWKRAFAVGEGFGEACLSFSRPPRSLAWETNLRAGAEGADAMRVDGDAFRDLFRDAAPTAAAFEALVEASADDHTLGLSGLVAPTEPELELESARSSRGSDDSAVSTPGGSREPRLSRASGASDSGAPGRDPEASPVHSEASDASDAVPPTPPTPSPRRPDARRERWPPPLVAVPRKHPRRLPKALRERLSADATSFAPSSPGNGDADDPLAFSEEWETDSDEERRAIETRRAEDAERSALKTLGALIRGKRAPDAEGRASKSRAIGKWSAAVNAKSGDASSALVAAFARARGRRDGNKPLRRRAPLGPPPLGAERAARLLACLETHPLFRGVEMRVLREAARDLELKLLRPGEALYARGSEKRDYAYVVEAGELEGRLGSSSEPAASAESRRGGSEPHARPREVRTAPGAVSVFRAGDILGDIELTFGVPRERSVVAAARGAKVWGMRRRWFERLHAPLVSKRRDVFRDVVRPSPVLSSLPFAEQRELAALLAERGEPFRLNAGETAVKQDEAPTRAFFVASGTADARVAVPELARPLLVGSFARGDAFGHLEFFLEEERDREYLGDNDDDADVRETCAVANRASVTASTRLRGVAVDGFAFRAVARPGTALRRALDAERATFANGVA